MRERSDPPPDGERVFAGGPAATIETEEIFAAGRYRWSDDQSDQPDQPDQPDHFR